LLKAIAPKPPTTTDGEGTANEIRKGSENALPKKRKKGSREEQMPAQSKDGRDDEDEENEEDDKEPIDFERLAHKLSQADL
jgi:hypothetical protein